MNTLTSQPVRILVVDDDAAIRRAYQQIFAPLPPPSAALSALVGAGAPDPVEANPFELILADQGEAAASLHRAALAEGQPCHVAFIDMRMPPGWDGLRTALALRAQDPSIYIVISTAFADYDVAELQQALGHDVVLLRKPFTREEVYQLALTLGQSWHTRERLARTTADIEHQVFARSTELDKRIAQQEALAEIATRCVELDAADDLDDAVHWSLARLGKVTGADRASLIRLSADGHCYNMTHEWLALGMPSLRDKIQGLPVSEFRVALQHLRRGGTFSFASLAEMPDELARLRTLVEGQVEAITSVPIMAGDTMTGLLSISAAQPGNHWDRHDQALLRTAGHLLVRTLEVREAQQRLAQSEANFTVLIQNLPGVVYRCKLDADWTMLFLSDYIETLSGYPLLDFIDNRRRTYADLIHPDDAAGVDLAVRAAIGRREAYSLDYRIIHADGRIRWVHENGRAALDSQGQVAWLEGVIIDITESKKVEADLHASQIRYQSLFENIGDGVAIYEVRDDGQDFIFKDFNSAGERIDRQNRAELIGRSLLEVRPGIEAFGLLEVLRRVWRTGEPEHFTGSVYQDDRLRGWYENYVYRLPGGEIVAVFKDITERRLAEEQIRQSEQCFRSIVETAQEGIWQVAADWRTVYVNRRMEELLGWAPGDMLGHSIADFMDAEAAAQLGGLQLKRSTGMRETHDFTFRRRDGTALHALVSATPMFDDQGDFNGATAMVTDITGHKRLEVALAATADFVAAPSGSHFCGALVAHAANTLELDYVHVARLQAGGTRVETEAAWLDGKLIDNWGYALCDTPCSEVLRHSRRLIEHDVQTRYPGDADLVKVGAEGYVGEPIIDDQGTVLGLIVGITRSPLVHGAMVQANLRILAARTAAEWQQRQALMALQSERDTTRNILQTAEAIIVALDRAGRITLINRKGCELLGYSEAELIGQDWFATCLPAGVDIEVMHSVFSKALARDLAGSEYYENPVRTRSGEERLIAWHNSSICDAEGRVIGGMSAGMDITERRLAEVRLQASEARFHRLFDAAEGMSIQGYLADGTVAYWNRASESLYGYSAAEAIGANLYDLIIPEAMRPAVIDAVRLMFETGQPSPAGRLALQHKDGSTVPVFSSHTIVQAPGQATLMFCVDVDLRELDRTEAALKVALTKYKTLFDCFPMGITVSDAQGRVLETNGAAERLLGISEEAHRQRSIDDPDWNIVRPDGTPMPTEEFAGMRALHEGQRVEDVEMGIVKGDGKTIWLNVTADVLPLEGYGVVVTYSDITARRTAEDQLRDMAYLDALTGLPNRRLLMDRFERARAASERNREYGALMMLDLDHFKEINDSHGHAVGDQLLVDVAQRLRKEVRQIDTVARLGGDEYVVLLENLGTAADLAEAQARTVAEKLRLALLEPYVLTPDVTLHRNSASIGVSLFLGDRCSADEVLKQADQALYRAKADGRNCLRF